MRLSGLLAGAMLAALVACGGDSGAFLADPHRDPSATLMTPSVAMYELVGSTGNGGGQISIHLDDYDDVTPLYASIDGYQSVATTTVTSAPQNTTADVLILGLQLRKDLALGDHAATATVHVCYDAACQKELIGSPMTVALQASVTTNIEVPALTTLTGTETTPMAATAIPVALPAPEAAIGGISLSRVASTAMSVVYSNGAVHVAAAPTAPGPGIYSVYGLMVSGTSSYEAEFQVQYVVAPASGVGQPLSAGPSSIAVDLAPGETKTQSIVVSPATWSTASTSLATVPGECGANYALDALGGGTYRLTVSAGSDAVGASDACVLEAEQGTSNVFVVVTRTIRAADGG